MVSSFLLRGKNEVTEHTTKIQRGKGTSLTQLHAAFILPVTPAIRKKINQKREEKGDDDEMENGKVFHQSGA